jgi:hypothetical protein
VISFVVAPVLHNKVPEYAEAVNLEVPSQLSTTLTVGAAGIEFTVISEVPELEHPIPDDAVAVYIILDVGFV